MITRGAPERVDLSRRIAHVIPVAMSRKRERPVVRHPRQTFSLHFPLCKPSHRQVWPSGGE